MAFFKKHAENETGIVVPDLSLFLKIALFEVKTSGLHLNFNIFRLSLTWTYNKNKLYQTSDWLSQDILIFDFLEKGLGLVSPPHFEYDFSEKNVSRVAFY